MVRSDKSLGKSIVNSKDWQSDALTKKSGGDIDRYQLPTGQKARMSFSGSESNSVFVKSENGKFVDVSGLTGMDLTSDGRTVGVIDFNRDGLNDFLLTNANKQTLNIFENRIGDLQPENHFVAVRVVGGNHENAASTEFANRDGIGSLITVVTDSQQQIREVRCGEGLATQNSRTCLLGLGSDKKAKSIKVRWPNGKTVTAENVESGKLVIFFENPAHSKSGNGIEYGSYERTESPSDIVADAVETLPFKIEGLSEGPNANRVAVVAGMATWCDACRNSLDELQMLNDQFRDSVKLYAIPIDEDDSGDKLDQYISKHKPACEFLRQDNIRGKAFTKFAAKRLGAAATPFSVVLRPSGRVVQTLKGIPTVSDLKKSLRRDAAN